MSNLKFSILLTLLVSLSVQAEIYRWVDDKGQVHYSDKPSKGSTPIKLKGQTTYSSPPLPSQVAKQQEAVAENPYDLFEIDSPADDATIRDNTGNVTLNLKIRPALRAGHKTMVKFGDKTYTSRNLSYYFPNVDRGSHTVEATIIDKKGRPISDPVSHTFHLKRHSVLLSPKARAEANARSEQSGNADSSN